jgi:hypothetical protein
MRISALLAVLALAALAQSCASVESAPDSLALIDIPDPPRLTVHTVGHPEAGAGLTQEIFFTQAMAGLANKLERAVQSQALHPGKDLDDALSAALARPGRALVHLPAPQKERSALLAQPSPPSTRAAIDLDVVPVSVGYWNTWPNGPWRPWVVLTYRLRDHNNGAVRASGQIGSGPAINGEPIAAVAPDDRFSFTTFDALVADPARAAGGLRETIRQVAAALAQRLPG